MYVIIMLADRDLMSDMYCGVRGDLLNGRRNEETVVRTSNDGFVGSC